MLPFFVFAFVASSAIASGDFLLMSSRHCTGYYDKAFLNSKNEQYTERTVTTNVKYGAIFVELEDQTPVSFIYFDKSHHANHVSAAESNYSSDPATLLQITDSDYSAPYQRPHHNPAEGTKSDYRRTFKTSSWNPNTYEDTLFLRLVNGRRSVDSWDVHHILQNNWEPKFLSDGDICLHAEKLEPSELRNEFSVTLSKEYPKGNYRLQVFNFLKNQPNVQWTTRVRILKRIRRGHQEVFKTEVKENQFVMKGIALEENSKYAIELQVEAMIPHLGFHMISDKHVRNLSAEDINSFEFH